MLERVRLRCSSSEIGTKRNLFSKSGTLTTILWFRSIVGHSKLREFERYGSISPSDGVPHAAIYGTILSSTILYILRFNQLRGKNYEFRSENWWIRPIRIGIFVPFAEVVIFLLNSWIWAINLFAYGVIPYYWRWFSKRASPPAYWTVDIYVGRVSIIHHLAFEGVLSICNPWFTRCCLRRIRRRAKDCNNSSPLSNKVSWT